MSDLISREALKETIINICGHCSNIIREYKDGVPDGNCAIQHIMNMIDNAPTVEPEIILARVNGKYASMIASFEEAIANGFTRDELQSWLYEIVMNNMDGSEKDKVFADCVVEIIDRLEGFERYVEEKRREGEA